MGTHHVTVLDAVGKSHVPPTHSCDWRGGSQANVSAAQLTAKPSVSYRRCSVCCQHWNRRAAAASFNFDNVGFSKGKKASNPDNEA